MGLIQCTPSTACWTMQKFCNIKDTWKQWIFKNSYSIKEAYMNTFKIHRKVNQQKLVYNRVSIRRAKFLQLAHGTRETQNQGQASQHRTDARQLFPLCATAKESTQQLYFDCPFSKKCLDGIENQVGIRLKPIAKMDFRKHKLKRIQQHIMSDICTFTIYALVWYNQFFTSFFCSNN